MLRSYLNRHPAILTMVCIFAVIGFIYVAIVSFSYLLPRDAAVDLGAGLCNNILMSAKLSRDERLIALHTKEICSSGKEQHKFSVCPVGNNIFDCGEHQILMSSRVIDGSLANDIESPLEFDWADSNSLVIRARRGVTDIIVATLGGASITTDTIE